MKLINAFIKKILLNFAILNLPFNKNKIRLLTPAVKISIYCQNICYMWNIKSFVFSPIQENTYVLYNESKNCLVVDPGCYDDGEKDRLQAFIEKSGLTPKMLLNTHCHLDHVFGNKFLAEMYGLMLHLHEKEKKVLEFAPASGLMWNMPFDNYQGEFILMKEGDVIKLGDDELK